MSDQPDLGGPAFPQTIRETEDGVDVHYQFGGMSLRDYFAAAALTGLLADPTPFQPEAEKTIDQVYAEKAYIYADAMIEARDQE